ncbi:MAG: fibronectin type III domain-containing protein [Cytophagales bacterium]|nr:fibronectin type III domain-containing protein [Cytophagales bacterium]
MLALLGASFPAAAQSDCLSFAPVVAYGSGGDAPFAVAAADFNGDGKPDLVVVNLASDNVGVLLNTSTCVPNGCVEATALSTTGITASSARLNWVAAANPPQWQLPYKTTKPGSKWTSLTVSGSARSLPLAGLVAGQNYLWQVRALCGKTKTEFAPAVKFQTLPNPSARHAAGQAEQSSAGLRVYPNPTRGAFVVELPWKADGEAQLELINSLGQTVQLERLRIRAGALPESIRVAS